MMRLTALLLSLAVGLAAFGQEQTLQDERAVNAILKLGGRVTRDEKLPGRPVVEVVFDGNMQITDAGLKDLKELKDLQFLCLAGTKISDAGLKDLKQALPKTFIYPP